MDEQEQPTPRATIIQMVLDTAVFLVFIPIVAVTIGVVAILNARDTRRAASQIPLRTRRNQITPAAPVSLPTHCDRHIVFSGRVASDVS
jgi:hypothetical protein